MEEKNISKCSYNWTVFNGKSSVIHYFNVKTLFSLWHSKTIQQYWLIEVLRESELITIAAQGVNHMKRRVKPYFRDDLASIDILIEPSFHYSTCYSNYLYSFFYVENEWGNIILFIIPQPSHFHASKWWTKLSASKIWEKQKTRLYKNDKLRYRCVIRNRL